MGFRGGSDVARAEDAQGKPTQGDISPRILVYEDNMAHIRQSRSDYGLGAQVKVLQMFEVFFFMLGRSRVQGSGFRVQGAGIRVQGAGFRVQGAGFRVQGSGFRI